jgi:predicted Zn-dependent protease
MSPRSLFAAPDAPLSPEAARQIADRVLRASGADDVRVTVAAESSGNTRFAGSEITTAGGTTDAVVTITSTVGRRRASTTTNLLDEAGLRRATELSERLARLSPEDPELMPELGPQTFADVRAYAEPTAALTPETRAEAVRKVIDAARAVPGAPDDLFVAGFLEMSAGLTRAVATKQGLFGYHPSSAVGLTTTVRTPDGTGSGWAGTGARDWSLIDPAALGRRAALKAIASRQPQAIEPGQYTVVLEPQAVADLIQPLMGSFAARAADEGRSPFAKKGGGTKLGEKVADAKVTLYTDPADPDLLGRPFDAEGLPIRRTLWLENGVLKSLAYTRYWARKTGNEPTAGVGGFGVPEGGLKMAGGTKSTEELIAGTERGVLVTRNWYIRFLDQRTVLLTGLTRDGTFLIENGKVTRPLKNFRWNESPLFMLNKVDEVGRAERTEAGVVMPSLRVRDFTFTSLSDAV